MTDKHEAEPAAASPKDPVAIALEEAQRQAEATKAIAQANLATMSARLPVLPTELPGSTLDATNAGSTFGTVNCYRAAKSIAEKIAADVLTPPWDALWIAAPGALASPRASLSTITNALKLANDAVSQSITELQNVTGQSASKRSQDTQIMAAVSSATVLVSSLLPLVFDAFTSTTTLKSGSTDLNNDAVANLVIAELLKAGKTVLQPDPTADLPEPLAKPLLDLEDKLVALQGPISAAAAVARQAASDAASSREELELRKSVLNELAKKATNIAELEKSFPQISALSSTTAQHELRRLAAEAAVSAASAVREAARSMIASLRVADAFGFTPLAHASLGAQLEEHSDSSIVRLEVSSVSAGSESEYHDRKVLSDYALHAGSATITYRLVDNANKILATNVYVEFASSRVSLKNGEINWV